MHILVLAFLVVVVVALVVIAIEKLPVIEAPWKQLLQVIAILGGALFIAVKAGWL